MSKRLIRKESEANECGGRPKQKEERRPTRNSKHGRKGEEERRNQQRERRRGGGGDKLGKAHQKANRSWRKRRTAEEYSREGGKEKKPWMKTVGRGERIETKMKLQNARTQPVSGKRRNT